MKNLIKVPYFISRNKKSLPLFILLIVALTLTSILSTHKIAEAATFPWVQNNWSDGIDGGISFPSHQLPNSAFSGWTKFSTSTTLTVGTSTITLAPISSSVSKMPFNDFINGTTATTTVSGTGTSSSVQLKVSSQFATGAWDAPAAPPFYPGNGGPRHTVYVASTPRGPGIYATEGTNGNDSNFWFYSLNEDSWYQMATSTLFWSDGSSLVYPASGDYIYAFQGYGSTVMKKYSISNNSWSAVANPVPANMSSGGDAFYSPDDGYIYAFQGGI